MLSGSLVFIATAAPSANIYPIITYGDRDVKKLVILALAIMPLGALAADTFSCIYSKAAVVNGKMGSMIGREHAKVEVNNGAMKVYRPNGTYLLSPQMKDDIKTAWKVSDASKAYVMSQDFKSFAVSDTIAKTTEQWAECSLDKAPSTVAEKKVKPTNWKKRNITQAEKSYVEKAIKGSLKDPDSAKFKHSYYVSNGEGAYCGLVNSKNSYGGYAGDTPFMAMIMHDKKGNATGAGVIAVGGDQYEVQATIETCRDNGYF